MKDPQAYIHSGILEEFVLGLTSDEENREVNAMALQHPQVQAEINAITASLMVYGECMAPEPDPTIKPMVMAIVDYTERLKGGEAPVSVPDLTEHSRISDFEEWINRKDMVLSEDFDQVYARLIGYEPHKMTALLWLKHGSPEEVHDAQYEKFLILEGTCDITIDGEVHSLKSGDYLQIPLYKKHHVRVTSLTPCKAVLQRMAA